MVASEDHDLVTNTLETPPQILDTPTSNGSGFRARLVGGYTPAEHHRLGTPADVQF